MHVEVVAESTQATLTLKGCAGPAFVKLSGVSGFIKGLELESETCVLKDLHPDTLYYYRVKAGNDVSKGSFTTLAKRGRKKRR